MLNIYIPPKIEYDVQSEAQGVICELHASVDLSHNYSGVVFEESEGIALVSPLTRCGLTVAVDPDFRFAISPSLHGCSLRYDAVRQRICLLAYFIAVIFRKCFSYSEKLSPKMQ